MERKIEQGGYHQLFFAGLETERGEETVLENVVVESLPTWTKSGNSYIWECAVYCPSDIFHQERDEYVELHARAYAAEAKKKRLRPGDTVTLRGFPYTQAIDLAGEQKSIKHLNVNDIEIIKRAKRMSVTVYEQKRNTGKVEKP